MPTPEMILAGLKLAANDSVGVAVFWHIIAVTVIVGLIAGWRPSRRVAGALLATPIASASIVAYVHGNPFNGSLLGAVAIVLVVIASRFDQSPIRMGSIPVAIAGVALLVFGLVYPHFLEGSPAAYLVAAPTGLIPCPTLSLVIGFALVGGGFGSRVWSLTLSVAGLFYGLFGMLRLGVMLDVGLVAGAVGLLAATFDREHHAKPSRARG